MDKAALLAAKLRGLVRAAGVDDLQPVGFPGGAAALATGSLWVLGALDLGARALGPALALTLRHEAQHLNLIVDDHAEATIAARRAAYFRAATTVHQVRGVHLETVERSPAGSGHTAKPSLAVVALIERAGADVVIEHGVVTAEVRGLEIARVDEVDGVEQLVVGVGRHDREAHRMAHEVADPAMALAALVRQVSAGRRAGAAPGLASHLGRERWLRWIACRRPELVGAAWLTSVDPPDRRSDLRAMSIAPATGETIDGAPAVFAFSVGVDPNLVPAAADVDPSRQLVLVVPEGDDDGITATLAAALKRPARINAVPVDWPAMGD